MEQEIKNILDNISETEYKSFEDMLTNLADNRLLKCYVHKGIHITINTIAELQNANENIKKLYI